MLRDKTCVRLGPSIHWLTDLTPDLGAQHLLFNRPNFGSIEPGIHCLADLTPDLSDPASNSYCLTDLAPDRARHNLKHILMEAYITHEFGLKLLNFV